jgi:hypothetical protein
MALGVHGINVEAKFSDRGSVHCPLALSGMMLAISFRYRMRISHGRSASASHSVLA